MKRKAKALTRAGRVIAFIERYCIVPEGERAGLKMLLDEFQKEFVVAVYDNPELTWQAILSMAKKNGKTGLIAALVLCHVAGPEAVLNSQIVSGALSKEQSALVYDYAAKMVGLNPKLGRVIRLVPSRKRMYGLARNVEFRALAADAKRVQGISPIVAILDEIGQIKGPKSAFVDAITTAQGAYAHPLLLIISTQAASDADLLSLMIDDAKTSGDPHTVCRVYEAEKDCKLTDEAAWKAGNPALGTFRSMADMRKLAAKAGRMPSFTATFRNLNLNQRVESVSPFVSKDVWLLGGRDLVPHEGVYPVYAGLDLSSIADLTALIAMWQAGGQWNVSAMFWAPEVGLQERCHRDKVSYDVWADQGYLHLTPGSTVDYDFVAEQLLTMAAEWNFKGLAFDRWRIEQFKAALARQEATPEFIELMTPFGQGFQSMAPALDALEIELLAGRIAHANNPVLTMCAANAVVVTDPAGNRKLDKSKRTGRIDGMTALVDAMGIAAGDVIDNSASFWEQAA